MNFFTPFFIGYRYWRARKANAFASFITFFAVSGIFLGVAALIIVSSVMNGLEGQLKQRILGAVPQLTVHSDTAFTGLPAFKTALRALPGVDGVVDSADTQAMIQSPANIAAVQLYGVNPGQVNGLSNVAAHMVYGAFSSLRPGQFNVVLGQQLAAKLGVQPGDKVRILSGNGVVYSPIGPVPSQRKFTVSGLFAMGSQVDGAVAYIDYQDARRLMRESPKGVNDLRLYLADPFTAPALAASVGQLAAKADLTVSVHDWRSRYGHLFGAVKMEKNMMSLMLSLIIAVAAFNIVSALVMMVVDKTADVAVLKTQGMTTGQVMGIFVVQGSLNAVTGLLLGLALGVAVTLNINTVLGYVGISVLGAGTVLPVAIEPAQLGWIVCGTLLLSLLAALYPAMRAARVQPACALRYE
ncbi:ABC transporter substrate-binding protein [Shewanella sp. NFH-SH190041]|uniref:lipoprotein-releasing ABC transporter permease subunit n=1 Tax=Shewanella sp. NFH-SH190041 TaxID=2950245 RepID=UPI0021C38A54|nr:lipoprotein-releasing ABC transporter permease subunit [Shewanella sp. NFH-SH190041]BDM63961.1 ABC transporter substrate-binding protein [Shewanella sp. NFH-SH190041]